MRRLTLLLSAVLISLTALVGTANAALLFNGTSLSKFTFEGDTAFTETTDPLGSGKTVFKSVVTNADTKTFGFPRALIRSGAFIEQGDEFWLKTKFTVPSSFPKSFPEGELLSSVAGPPGVGAPPWEIETWGETIGWGRNSTYGWDVPWEIPLEREKWYSIVLHERFDEAGKGWIEMWVNGEQITFFKEGTSTNLYGETPTTKLVMATMDETNDEGPNTVKLAQSRANGEPATATVYFGTLKVGETRADVSDPWFEGDQISDFPEELAVPGAITEVSDPLGSGETVIKTAVEDNDREPKIPSENPRAQLGGPAILDKGEEFWLSTKFLIPEGFPSIPKTGWMTLVSVYGPPYGGSAPWHLEVSNDELAWQRTATYSEDVPWEVPLEKGKWTKLLLHEKLDESGKGFIEMWINGSRITFFKKGTSVNPSKLKETNHLAMSTMEAAINGGSANNPRIAQYRKKEMFTNGTVYFGPLRVGEERADVDF